MSRLTLHVLLHTGLITAAMLSLAGQTTAQTSLQPGAQHQGMHHQPMKVETKPFAPPSGASSASVYDDLSNVPLWSNLGTVS
jgi:hypothetical protein